MSNARTSRLCPRRCWLQPWALLVLLSGSLGCSLSGVQPAPKTANEDAGVPEMCTSGIWRPLLDLAGLTAFAVAAGVGIDQDAHVVTALGAGGGAIFATSMLYGAATLDDCGAPSPP